MIYNEHITNLPNFSRAGLGFELPYTKVMDMIQQAFPNKTIIDSSMLMLFENHYPKIKHYKLFSPPSARKKNMLLVQLLDPTGFIENNNPQIKDFGWEGIPTVSNRNCDFRLVAEASQGMSKHFGLDSRTDYTINWGDDFKPYIMYNRKPHIHRIQAVDLLKKHQLLDEGYVSLANELTVGEAPKHNDPYDVMGNDNILPKYNGSLGNDHIWASHFLNVISESSGPPCSFLSEKTFKPIVGLRPFVSFNKERTQYLHRSGFKTFNNFWDESMNWVDQIEYVCSQSKETLQEWYESNEMQDILSHNRFHYFNAYSGINYGFLDDFLKKMSIST
tara:strand:+ start:30 stop:1025 length:996 start_codon:yes stop_codon:yes gene_type:complete